MALIYVKWTDAQGKLNICPHIDPEGARRCAEEHGGEVVDPHPAIIGTMGSS
jgi:hypothetical protein